MKKACYLVVDLDDTLIMTRNANNLAYIEAIREVCRINLLPILGKRIRLTGEIIDAIMENSTDALIDKVKKLKKEKFRKFLHLTYLNNKVINIINRHSDKNLVLLTNSSKERAITTLAYHQLESFFHSYIFNDPQNGNKYLHLIHHLDANPHDCIVLEDDPIQIGHALSVGIPQTQIIKI